MLPQYSVLGPANVCFKKKKLYTVVKLLYLLKLKGMFENHLF